MNTDNHNPETITIQLTQGQQTVISAIDADLAEIKWHAKWTPHYKGGGKFTASRRKTTPHAKNRQITVYLHRVILERILGRELVKGELADHINGNPLDNRRANLRVATPLQNSHNRGVRRDSVSGYKGVRWIERKKRWVAFISINGKMTYLGMFTTPELAHAAYCEAAKKYHGEFANFG